jgi:hypothetical protein
MAEEGNTRALIKRIALRVFKAALWGFVTYLLVYYPVRLLYPLEALPFEYSQLFNVFVTMVVFFAVATKLFSGTILEYAFSMAKALFIIIYFLYAFNGGVISLTVPVSETTVNLVLDLRAFLAMLIFVNLLALAKSVLQATDFLARKAEAGQLSVR